MRYKIVISSIAASMIFVGCSVKPELITPGEIKKDVNYSLEQLNKLSIPVTKPISLDEAIQRAVDNNLSKKLDVLSSALAQQKIDIVAYESLPSLTGKAGYSKRDNYAASASTSFTDGNPDPLGTDPSYSVSQDKESNTAGVAFSWNILDFGLSYVRAGQQSNRYLIAKEKTRKSIHNIKQEVRSAYYQAVSADELLKRINPIMKETKKAFEDSKNIIKLKVEAPIKSLTYQRELLEVIRSLNTLEENLVKSKTELARLMGLKPGTKFELAEVIKEKYELPQIKLSINELERLALENRPELQETRYQLKISEAELKAVMLKMLPSINLNAGYSYDNSQYLLNNEWMSYGASVSWNLLNVFNASLNNKLAKTQIELAKQQKMALSMAVVSQVHLSLLDYAQAKKSYKLSEDYFEVAKEIFNIIQNENALNVNGQLSLIKEKLNYLISNLRLSSSYAKVQNAYGKVISSVGNEKVFKEKEVIKEEVKKEQTKETKPTLVLAKKTKIEEIKTVVEKVKVPVKKELAYDDSKPTIEIKKDATILKLAEKNSVKIRNISKGEKINFKHKVFTEDGFYYQVKDGYIKDSSVRVIN